jgi:glycine/D-amino acid oxidase-like deaminating enzyme
VQYEIDTTLTELTRKIGRANAVRAWRRSRLAVDKLSARLEELGVPRVRRRNSLYLSGDRLDKNDLAHEHDARCAAGLTSLYLDAKALQIRFGIARQAALLSYGDLVLDPRSTALSFLREVVAHNTRIFAPVEVVDVTQKRTGAIAISSSGHRIHCRRLVFATGYELPRNVSYPPHRIISTWAVATAAQSQPAWPEQCMIWEASWPYLYLRTTSIGQVICGGEDEEFSDENARDALLSEKTKTLMRKLRKLLPKLNSTIAHAWAGTFGETKTGLPIIGQVPSMRNCWVALGYGGNGITYAQIAADIIAGAIIGIPDLDADLYEF